MDYSFPNQKIIHINRIRPDYDFLGIKNENWQAAARNLNYPAFVLYLYLASNKDDYELALSSAAVQNAIGMARSTYYDQIHKLIQKGYLVNTHGNCYEFFEVPVSGNRNGCSVPGAGHDAPVNGMDVHSTDKNIPTKDIEINNTRNNATNRINIMNASATNQEEESQEEFKF